MKQQYREVCGAESSIPLFSQAWWLDAVAGEDWDVVLVESGGRVVAAMPYYSTKRFGMRIIGQPPLTQSLGPWIRPIESKYAKRLSREKAVMSALIDQLPTYAHFCQNWDFRQGNWLPFYWKGFSQTTRYTYRLNNLDDEELLWGGLQENIRTDIRKARKRHALKVRTDDDVSRFYRLNAMVFQRQGKAVPYPERLVQRIDRAAAERECRRILIAEDEQGRAHAAIYLLWDDESAYYLMGGSDPSLRASGATSLCLWEAIRFASQVSNGFDFEGSMLEPVERYFRAFGATQTPYHRVFHTQSKILRAGSFLRSMRSR